MATRKAKEDERLDPSNLEKVIALLEPEDTSVKPITKKEACAILNISYNTTRLATLIEKYKEKKAKDAERRAEKRGKPPSAAEIQYVIAAYLEGTAVANIANAIYRGPAFVNRILEINNVPVRASSLNYFQPELIPEGAMRERFKVGQIVYSARYDSTAKIHTEVFQHGNWVYRIWLLSDKWQQFAYQEAAELASLEHIEALGIKL